MMTCLRPLSRLALVALVAFGPSAAQAVDRPAPSDHALNVASCQGYYTAVVEHARLVAGEHDGAVLRRDLIEAMMDGYLAEHSRDREYAVTMMRNRVQARSQMRNLLSAAEFNRDDRRQRLARGQMRRLLMACDGLMIDNRSYGF